MNFVLLKVYAQYEFKYQIHILFIGHVFSSDKITQYSICDFWSANTMELATRRPLNLTPKFLQNDCRVCESDGDGDAVYGSNSDYYNRRGLWCDYSA